MSYELARKVLELLAWHGDKLVCAESCTAGLVSATLAGIPGASNHLCGSAVVYRNGTKTAWLKIPDEILLDPHRGDVCHETAVLMARGVLEQTPEATLAISITGHLGPNAPQGFDGLAYIGIAWPASPARPSDGSTAFQIQLQEPPPQSTLDVAHRVNRQNEAMVHVLQAILSFYACPTSLGIGPQPGFERRSRSNSEN